MNQTAAAPPKTAADPFAIGWREVKQVLDDGSTKVEQVPLTLEDALHPREGDTIVQNTFHDRDWVYLREVAHNRVAADPTALVLSDCKVLWSDGVHHSPDISVCFGVDDPDRFRSVFDVAAEGTLPQLIIEVVSPSTRDNDVVTKVEHYHRYKVPVFVIVDRKNEESPPELIGYQYAPRRYVRMTADDDGRLWLQSLAIYLGVRSDRVVAYDGDTDRELGDYVAVCAELEAAESRLAEEERARRAAESRASAAESRASAAELAAAADRTQVEALQARLRELESRPNGTGES